MIAAQSPSLPFEEIGCLLGLLREVNDTKRLYSYNLGQDSYATWVFRQACGAVSGGHPLEADVWSAAMVGAARLGAITPDVLRDGGLDEAERTAIFKESILTHEALPKKVCDSLTTACHSIEKVSSATLVTEAKWVERLATAPRAGATCPGKPRIALEPPEMHSDHCATVAVYAYLLADFFGADREDAWLIGLCHHFHNAYLPDAGFTGEMMLGTHLDRMIETWRSRVIDGLPERFRSRVIRLFEEITGVATPLAKTFHAADTIDRVVQMEHYERAARFRVRQAMVDLNLVHEGAAQAFQHELLKSIGLFSEPIT